MYLVIELFGRDPVSKLSLDTFGGFGNGLDLLLGADDRLGLDSGDILRVGPGEEAVVVLGKGDNDSLLDELCLQLQG